MEGGSGCPCGTTGARPIADHACKSGRNVDALGGGTAPQPSDSPAVGTGFARRASRNGHQTHATGGSNYLVSN
jgi:hypothetical protein